MWYSAEIKIAFKGSFALNMFLLLFFSDHRYFKRIDTKKNYIYFMQRPAYSVAIYT